MPHEMKTGVVLINLGTPDDTKLSSIRRYLREFLLDPRVIDLNGFLRRVLVYGAILPFRPFKTSKAYRKVWEPSGSLIRSDNFGHLAKLVNLELEVKYGKETEILLS